MSLDFDARFPRFRLGPHDRATIDGRAFRVVQQMEESFVLIPADGGAVAETFTFAHLNALSAAGRVRHRVEHFLPPSMRAPAVSGGAATSVSRLPPEGKARLDVRNALVEGFIELWRAGWVKKTEASIGSLMPEICEAARAYLRQTADLAEADREARARSGEGRRRRGGTIQATIDPVHPRTLLAWTRRREKGGKPGLADDFAGRGNRMGYFKVEETALLASVVRKSWLNINRPPKTRVLEDVRIAFAAANAERKAAGLPPLRVPARHAVRAAIKAIQPFHADVARFGPQEAVKRHRPVGPGLEVSRPLERVVIDECRIDLITEMASAGLLALFTPEELVAFGLDDKKARWCLCAAIDCRTRVILGMRLVRNPDTSTAKNVLRMILSDKGGISDATGALTRWTQYGLPELLVADNGSAFKSIRFTDACNDLGVTLERTITGAPAMRGTIERFFGTFGSGLLSRLPGLTFSDVLTRGDHPSEARACLGPEDLCFAMVRWVTDIYHNSPHDGLGGRTPLQQWEADHREGNFPVRGIPDAPARRRAFGLRTTRQATREGINCMGVRYHGADLAESVVRNGSRAIDIRWDEEDIGAIEAYFDGARREIPAIQPGLVGLHTQVWIAARRALKAQGPRAGSTEEAVVFKAIEDIKAMGAHRSLQFGLIDKTWTEKELSHLEASLFANFRITPTVPTTKACDDGHGRAITPQAPDTGAPAGLGVPTPSVRGGGPLRFEE